MRQGKGQVSYHRGQVWWVNENEGTGKKRKRPDFRSAEAGISEHGVRLLLNLKILCSLAL